MLAGVSIPVDIPISDSNADWTSKKLILETLCNILKKTCLSTDFGIISNSSEGYVEQTYMFIKQHYDSVKPLHHLALLINIIQLAAKTFCWELSEVRFCSDTSVKVFIYKTKPWVERPKKKGHMDKLIIIVMVMTLGGLARQGLEPRLHVQRRGDRAVNHLATSVSCPSPKIGAWAVRAEGGKESGQ